MMETPLVKELFEKFEAITIKVDDVECWSARQLQEILGYSKWDNFINVIEKAKTACIQSNNNVADHFADVGKMVDLGSITKRNRRYSFNTLCMLVQRVTRYYLEAFQHKR